MKNFLIFGIIFPFLSIPSFAQTKTNPVATSNNTIPISKADLGTFPYFKTLSNFKALNAGDSITQDMNRVYFYDGKSFFTVDGKVSVQKLKIVDDKKPTKSEFQIVDEYDKMVSALGGKKVFSGKMPEDGFKKLTGGDWNDALSKNQIVGSVWYGLTEYVVKTPEKEVWIQLVPNTIASGYYSLLIVEKTTPLISANTNKVNQILTDLETKGKATTHLHFAPDSLALQSESKDEFLNLLGIFQAHPDWKIKLEVHNAPVGKPEYILDLTQKRAQSIKTELMNLGVKGANIQVLGLGDTKPLSSNDSENGRLVNTRIEITKN